MNKTITFILSASFLIGQASVAQDTVRKDIAYDDEHASQILDFYPVSYTHLTLPTIYSV